MQMLERHGLEYGGYNICDMPEAFDQPGWIQSDMMEFGFLHKVLRISLGS